MPYTSSYQVRNPVTTQKNTVGYNSLTDTTTWDTSTNTTWFVATVYSSGNEPTQVFYDLPTANGGDSNLALLQFTKVYSNNTSGFTLWAANMGYQPDLSLLYAISTNSAAVPGAGQYGAVYFGVEGLVSLTPNFTSTGTATTTGTTVASGNLTLKNPYFEIGLLRVNGRPYTDGTSVTATSGFSNVSSTGGSSGGSNASNTYIQLWYRYGTRDGTATNFTATVPNIGNFGGGGTIAGNTQAAYLAWSDQNTNMLSLFI
jgi:hypothetical protein